MKFYLRNVGYFEPDESRWANQTGTLVLFNGRGEEAMKLQNLKTDALGAVESEVIIPKDAVLGNWSAVFQIADRISASVSLRVEEYRKPEYEVKVEAPDAPVKLGDKFTATVKATYFHGAPVRNANVEIIVKRGSIGERWFPVWRWDWLYGPGAWWNGSEASWHPGWKSWGCIPPHPPWWQGDRWTPDELVTKRNVPIGPDGTAKIEIDTAPAKLVQGDMDAKYTVEARVVDASRREERGTGSVIAGRNTCTMTIEAARTSIQNARWAAQNRSSPAAGESDLVVPATTASDRPAESGPRTGTTVASVGGMKVTSRCENPRPFQGHLKGSSRSSRRPPPERRPISTTAPREQAPYRRDGNRRCRSGSTRQADPSPSRFRAAS